MLTSMVPLKLLPLRWLPGGRLRFVPRAYGSRIPSKIRHLHIPPGEISNAIERRVPRRHSDQMFRRFRSDDTVTAADHLAVALLPWQTPTRGANSPFRFFPSGSPYLRARRQYKRDPSATLQPLHVGNCATDIVISPERQSVPSEVRD